MPARKAGRPPGTGTAKMSSLKAAIMTAFSRAGGATYLERLARNDPKTFVPLLAKLVPLEVKAEVEHQGGIQVQVVTGITRAPGEPEA
jgi:hypothetical protein